MAGTAMGVGWGPRGRWSYVRVHHGAQLTSENSCEWTSFLFLVPKITNTRAHADGIRFRLESSGGHQEHQVQEPSCAALRSRTQHEQEQQQQQQPSSPGFRRRPSRLNAALQVPVVILSEKMIARDAQCREHRPTRNTRRFLVPCASIGWSGRRERTLLKSPPDATGCAPTSVRADL